MPKLEVFAYIAGLILTIAIVLYILASYIITIPTRPITPIPTEIPRIETPATAITTPVKRETVIVRDIVYLPLPRKMTNVTVEEAILWRRSIREYTSQPITIYHLSMLLWAAYGVTETTWGLRASPSAGATYPLEVYIVVKERGVVLEDGSYLEAGVYRYYVYTHTLKLVKKGDYTEDLYRAALNQEWVRDAAINIVVTAVFERTTRIYGERGRVRYVPMEVGHLGQNVYLMATAMGLGTVVIGAFYDDDVSKILSSPLEEVPMYIIPIGVPKTLRKASFEEVQSYIEKNR
jgi:SagB-type dehydrogenase family enzyme